jgi:superfamily II DNA or RNA helicase
VKLTVENVWTHAEGPPEQEGWLDGVLSAETSQYVEGRYGQESRWLRRVESVREGACFPSGLVPVVMRRASKDIMPVELVDQRHVPSAVHNMSAPPTWLRDYQVAAVQRILSRGRGILDIAMSGGKTEIFVALSLCLPCEWLYLVKKVDLVQQTIESYERLTGERSGTFKAGEWRRGTSNVTCAGFDAWWAALKRGAPGALELGREVEAVNVDECHTAAAETLWRGLLALPNAYFRVGQSGTPLFRDELENLRVIGALGPVVYKLSTSELVSRGVVAKATVRMVECVQQIPKEKQAKTWGGVQTQFVLTSAQRNRLVASIAEQAAKPCLVFVERIKHGRLVLEALKRLGVSAEFVHGKASLGQRKAAVGRLVQGQIDVLVANEIFSTGLNAPAVRSTVNAAGGRAPIATLQRMGRAMRKKPDGSLDCETWDINDLGHYWIERHSGERLETYQKEGHEVQLVTELGVK